MATDYILNGGAELDSLDNWTSTNVTVATGEFSLKCFSIGAMGNMLQQYAFASPVPIQEVQLRLLVKGVTGEEPEQEVMCPVYASVRLLFDGQEDQNLTIPIYPLYDNAIKEVLGTGWVQYYCSFASLTGSITNFEVNIETTSSASILVDNIELFIFEDVSVVVEQHSTSLTELQQSAIDLLNTMQGYILIRKLNGTNNEILIMDSPYPTEAVAVWRWNLGGLGFSNNCVGVDNEDRVYTTAITMDGTIYANLLAGAYGTFINLVAGNPDAPAGMSKAHMRMYVTGSEGSEEALIEIHDTDGTTKLTVNRFGIKFEGVLEMRVYSINGRTGLGFFAL